jgi:hypothetical protein
MPIRHLRQSGQPVSVRASFEPRGRDWLEDAEQERVAGEQGDLSTDAPRRRDTSPTDLPSWSAITISTSEGGTSW